MSPDVMKRRTKAFAMRILKIGETLPKNSTAGILRNQIIRCGTSVAANYRAACRARRKAEFIAKLGIAEEEADETMFWLELIEESGMLTSKRLQKIKLEANEITAIIVSSIKSAKTSKSHN